MRITFDPAKRAATLEHRGLDFADAAEVFAGLHTVAPDDRRDYGEPRFISAGYLHLGGIPAQADGGDRVAAAGMTRGTSFR